MWKTSPPPPGTTPARKARYEYGQNLHTLVNYREDNEFFVIIPFAEYKTEEKDLKIPLKCH